MKMNFKYLLMTVVLAIGLGSCSSDDDNVNGGSTTSKEEKTLARITLTQKSISTYATEAPTSDEGEVKSVTLYIFNAQNNLEEIVPFALSEVTAQSKVFQSTAGVHYFYAAVNSPAVTGIERGQTMNTVIQKLIDVAAISDITNTTNGFFMTNVERPSGVNLEVATEQEAINGVKNDITIPVGRAVAKVNVNFEPDVQPLGKLTNVEYKVKNNPVKMHFMPIFNGTQLLTPFFSEAIINPNNYFHNPGLHPADFSEASYAMENSNEQPRQGNSTYVMIKGNYVPNNTYDKDGGSEIQGNPSAPATFWRIKKNDGTYMSKLYHENPTGGSEMDAAGAGATIIEYTNGESFYRLSLGDDNITGNFTKKYTIKRNSYYKVKITSVSGPGSNTEGGEVTDPNEELEVETYIKASIQVLDWVVIEQNGGI